MRLFDRGPAEVTPTPAGELVIERARRLVFDERCLKRDVELYRERKLGDTAFGVGPYPASTFLAALLAEMRREFAQINLRVQIGNWELLLDRLLVEDIEFFVADTRELPPDPRIDVKAYRREPAGFYVRAGHPLARRRSVKPVELWQHGVVSVRLPKLVGTALSRLLGLGADAMPPLALECDDVELLKKTALASDAVLGAPHVSVQGDVRSGALVKLPVAGLPPLYSMMGIVTLRGRTPSPMAETILHRLHTLDREGDTR
jgi:DNA-binding transcriptional LysR family regulator